MLEELAVRSVLSIKKEHSIQALSISHFFPQQQRDVESGTTADHLHFKAFGRDAPGRPFPSSESRCGAILQIGSSAQRNPCVCIRLPWTECTGNLSCALSLRTFLMPYRIRENEATADHAAAHPTILAVSRPSSAPSQVPDCA